MAVSPLPRKFRNIFKMPAEQGASPAFCVFFVRVPAYFRYMSLRMRAPPGI